jgi:hypothetical protein
MLRAVGFWNKSGIGWQCSGQAQELFNVREYNKGKGDRDEEKRAEERGERRILTKHCQREEEEAVVSSAAVMVSLVRKYCCILHPGIA